MKDESQIFIFPVTGGFCHPFSKKEKAAGADADMEREEDSGRERSYVRGELGRREGVI